MYRVSYSRTSTRSTRNQKRSSTNQHSGITRTCAHTVIHAHFLAQISTKKSAQECAFPSSNNFVRLQNASSTALLRSRANCGERQIQQAFLCCSSYWVLILIHKMWNMGIAGTLTASWEAPLSSSSDSYSGTSSKKRIGSRAISSDRSICSLVGTHSAFLPAAANATCVWWIKTQCMHMRQLEKQERAHPAHQTRLLHRCSRPAECLCRRWCMSCTSRDQPEDRRRT